MGGNVATDFVAQKQAHVGVALLNGTSKDLIKIAEHFRTTKMKEIYEKQVSIMKRFNQPSPPVPIAIAHLYPPGPTNPHYEKAMQREAEKKGAAAAVAAQSDAKDKQNGSIETITSPGAQAL